MKGVDCAIDAVGYQARDHKNPKHEKPTQVLENCVRVVNATGSIGVIGVIFPGPGARDNVQKGHSLVPVAEFLDNGITIGSGQAPVKKYNEYLRPHRHGACQTQPNRNHHIQIDEAPDAYDKFNKRIEGYTKVLIRAIENAA